MDTWEIYGWIVAGIVVSIVFPVVRHRLYRWWPRTASGAIPDWVKKYFFLLIFSSLTGLIVLAFLQSRDTEFTAWWTPFLAGFAWESAMEKIIAPTNPNLTDGSQGVRATAITNTA